MAGERGWRGGGMEMRRGMGKGRGVSGDCCGLGGMLGGSEMNASEKGSSWWRERSVGVGKGRRVCYGLG